MPDKRWMILPKNTAYPNFNEVHREDDWCAKAGCVPVSDSCVVAGKMAEPKAEDAPQPMFCMDCKKQLYPVEECQCETFEDIRRKIAARLNRHCNPGTVNAHIDEIMPLIEDYIEQEVCRLWAEEGAIASDPKIDAQQEDAPQVQRIRGQGARALIRALAAYSAPKIEAEEAPQLNPFSKGYNHRNGKPVSDACGDGRHSECTETYMACHCTYRGGHKTPHAYLNTPVADSVVQGEPAKSSLETLLRWIVEDTRELAKGRSLESLLAHAEEACQSVFGCSLSSFRDGEQWPEPGAPARASMPPLGGASPTRPEPRIQESPKHDSTETK